MPSLLIALLLALVPGDDLLMLGAVAPGPGIPPGWTVRPVRGRPAPSYAIRDDGDGRALQLSGAGAAAWLYRELPEYASDPAAAVRWEWRVHRAPLTSDLARKARDDSPIRVFVVFGKVADLRSSARAIFYTWGNEEPADLAQLSHASDRFAIVRLAGREHADGTWRTAEVRPFDDYRRFWKGAPRPIGAVGVMQDTDQTGEVAEAELRLLQLVRSRASEASGS